MSYPGLPQIGKGIPVKKRFVMLSLVAVLLGALIVPALAAQRAANGPPAEPPVESAVQSTVRPVVESTSKSAVEPVAEPLVEPAEAVEEPALACDTDALTLTIMRGEWDRATETLGIWNSGDGRLCWSIEDDAEWLGQWPPSGVSRGEVDVVTISASAKGLDLGTYSATITISGGTEYRSSDSVRTVDATLNVIEPRILPMIAGFSTEDSDGAGAGRDAYEGINLLFVNGEDVWTCPTLDLIELRIAKPWACWLEYGSELHHAVDTYGDDYSYYDIIGGEVWGIDEELWQYEPVKHLAEGTVVGGKSIDWGAFEDMEGAGWLLTVHLDTGSDEGLNGEDPGDLTHKCFLIEDFGLFILGAARNLEAMFQPALWEGPEEGILTALMRELPGLMDMADGWVQLNDNDHLDELAAGMGYYLSLWSSTPLLDGSWGELLAEAPIVLDQIAHFLEANDEEIAYNMGSVIDVIIPLMPYLPGLIDIMRPLMNLVEPVLSYLLSPVPPMLIMQPAGTT